MLLNVTLVEDSEFSILGERADNMEACELPTLLVEHEFTCRPPSTVEKLVWLKVISVLPDGVKTNQLVWQDGTVSTNHNQVVLDRILWSLLNQKVTSSDLCHLHTTSMDWSLSVLRRKTQTSNKAVSGGSEKLLNKVNSIGKLTSRTTSISRRNLNSAKFSTGLMCAQLS